jgi:hypothetical protein
MIVDQMLESTKLEPHFGSAKLDRSRMCHYTKCYFFMQGVVMPYPLRPSESFKKDIVRLCKMFPAKASAVGSDYRRSSASAFTIADGTKTHTTLAPASKTQNASAATPMGASIQGRFRPSISISEVFGTSTPSYESHSFGANGFSRPSLLNRSDGIGISSVSDPTP